MEPDPDFVTNYYEGKEYLDSNPYAYFHPDPAPNIDSIQSKVSNYGTPINDDWYADKEALLKNVFHKCYTISQGSKQWRSQINSINSFLNYLDTDYRKSLYNHSKLHYNKGNLDNSWKDEILTKEHFTFRNIHQNLGNIRW